VHIGLLTTSYPRHAGDYAGSFVADRAQQLLSAGHSVEVLAAGDGDLIVDGRTVCADGSRVVDGRWPGSDDHPVVDGRRPSSDGDRVVDGRIMVTRVPGGSQLFYGAGAPEALEKGGTAWLSAVRFSTALAAAARKRAEHWDGVESHWLVPCALAASASAARLPRRAYAHSGDVALLERIPFGRALARRLARDGTDLRFVSGELHDRFARLCGAPTGTVEPLAIPTSLFPRRTGTDPDLRRRLGLSAPTVLAVGRLVPIKGHDLLLRACARASAGVADLQKPEVVILGDGPERERLVRLATARGVTLRLPGFVPRAEVADWLRATDLYAQPSIRLPNGRGEGAPIATREALAIGIPVLATGDVVALAGAIRDHLAGRRDHPVARRDHSAARREELAARREELAARREELAARNETVNAV
jgi:glycosyltransferase involved in cell wall biosynthesis